MSKGYSASEIVAKYGFDRAKVIQWAYKHRVSKGHTHVSEYVFSAIQLASMIKDFNKPKYALSKPTKAFAPPKEYWKRLNDVKRRKGT